MSKPDAPKPVSEAAPPAQEAGGMHENLLERLNRRRQRLWRRTKRTVRLLVGIPLGLGIIALIVTRSPLVRWVVASRVENLTGLKFNAERVVIELDGRLVMRAPTFDAPSVPGAAARVLSAESASIDLDWSGVLTGRVTPVGVRFERPMILLSQSKGDSGLNFSTLMSGPGVGGATGAASSAPPEITVSDATIRFAEHDAAGMLTVLKDIRVAGSLLPVRSEPPVFAIAMTQYGTETSRAMVLDGQIDLGAGTGRLQLRNIGLSDWPAESVPSAYRDIWGRLGVRGSIKTVVLTSAPSTGVMVELTVDDVSMSALVPTENAPVGVPPDLRMSGVTGSIKIARAGLRADLQGQLQGQQGQSRVRLITQGLELTSPLTCEIRGTRIKVTKDPAFLFYVPRTVREYFEYFSGPTADVDVVAVISRASPVNGQISPLGVTGTLTFRNGVAAFHKFPYPFKDMSGVVRFDESRLVIEQIRGRGPTGAGMTAQGVIGPLTDDAKVDVTIAVQRVPVDEHLLKAMPASRREAAETVFNRDEYQRLLAANLIREPNKMGVDGTRSAPPFPFAGEGDITVHVTRELGSESIWTTNVDCRFRELGVIARPFPMPVIGRDVRLRITDNDASIEEGDFAGPRGGRAIVNARVVFFEDGKRVVKPTIDVNADGLPVDELLLGAVRRGEQQSPVQRPSSVSGDALERVALAGTVDCIAKVSALPPATPEEATNPDMHYDLTLDLAGLRAVPRVDDRIAALALSEFKGILRLTPERVWMDNVQARLARTTGPAGPELPSDITGPLLPARDADAGFVAVTLDAALERSPEAGRLGATIRVDGLTLSDPIEEVVQVVSPEAAAWLSEQRAQRAPTGSIDVVVRAGRTSAARDEAPDIAVSLARVHDVEFAALGGRIGVDLGEGNVMLSVPPSGPATLRASGVKSALTFNAMVAGTAGLDGVLTIDPKSARLIAPTSAAATLAGWQFESPLVRPALASFGGDSAERRFAEFAPMGLFDADLRVEAAAAAAATDLGVDGIIRPHTLSIERAGQRITFDHVLGALSFTSRPGAGFVGCVDRVVGSTDRWTARVDGSFSSAPQSGADVEPDVRLDLALSVDADEADDALLALVPLSAREAMQKLDVQITGPVRLHDATLTGALDSPDVPLTFAGSIAFENARLDPGLSVQRMSGELDVFVATPGSGRADIVRLDLASPRLIVSGVSASDFVLHASSTDVPGEIAIPRFSASTHDGRVVGSAHLAPAGAEGRKTYRVDATASGVAFAPLLEELSAIGAAEPLTGPMPDATRDPDVSRGRLDARLSLSGVTGDQRSRVGRGAVRISRGDVLRLPVIFPLMQLSNLVLPSEESLRGLEAEFHLSGARAYFPRVIATGQTIALEGSGTLDLPDMGIDFRFNSKNNNPIPVLSGVWEALRNEVLTTTVTGSLKDPKVGSESFRGIRSLFAGGVGLPAAFSSEELISSRLADFGRFRAPGRGVPTIEPTPVSAAAEPGPDDR